MARKSRPKLGLGEKKSRPKLGLGEKKRRPKLGLGEKKSRSRLRTKASSGVKLTVSRTPRSKALRYTDRI